MPDRYINTLIAIYLPTYCRDHGRDNLLSYC